MESSPITIAPMLLRNLVTTMFIYADKSLVFISKKSKLLETIRYILITCFLFLLRLLPSLFPCLDPTPDVNNVNKTVAVGSYSTISCKGQKGEPQAPVSASGVDSGIGRALTQLLWIINDIPVSSRKYEVVRSLAEKLIDENHTEDVEALRLVNRTVLSAAFSRALDRLEAVMVELDSESLSSGSVKYRLFRFMKVVRSFKKGHVREMANEDEVRWLRGSAEKLVAELLWLAQKMASCGDEEEAVWRWASASNVAWFALTAEPRLQCSLVKVTAFLFMQAKEMGVEDFDEAKKELHRQTKKRMLISWLPLLCRATNGTDAPILNTNERAELERVLEGIIDDLGKEEDQEQVLSLWLHHFTHSPSSDWPNLHNSYAHWCSEARRHLILQ